MSNQQTRMVPIKEEHYRTVRETLIWSRRNRRLAETRLAKPSIGDEGYNPLSAARLQKRLATAEVARVRWTMICDLMEHIEGYLPGGQMGLFDEQKSTAKDAASPDERESSDGDGAGATGPEEGEGDGPRHETGGEREGNDTDGVCPVELGSEQDDYQQGQEGAKRV